MDALGDEQAVERLFVGTQNVGDHPVADAQHAGAIDRPSEQPLALGQRQAVDRVEGFAGHGDPAAEAFVQIGQRAAAVDKPVAALDHPVRVGADQFESARHAGGQAFAIVLGRFGLVIDRAGDRDEGRVGGTVRDLQAETVIEGPVAVRTDDPGRAGRAFGEFVAGGVARGDDGAPAVARHVQGVELDHHAWRRARRVGDQHDVAMVAVEPAQGLAGPGPAFAPVVDHAPDVAEQQVIVGGDVGQAGEGVGEGHAGLIAGSAAGVKAARAGTPLPARRSISGIPRERRYAVHSDDDDGGGLRAGAVRVRDHG